MIFYIIIVDYIQILDYLLLLLYNIRFHALNCAASSQVLQNNYCQRQDFTSKQVEWCPNENWKIAKPTRHLVL